MSILVGLLLFLLPGWGWLWVASERPWWLYLSVGPVLSVGWVYSVGGVLAWVGAGFHAGAIIPLSLLPLVVGGIVRVVRRDFWTLPGRSSLAEGGVVGGVLLISILNWVRTSQGGKVLPGDDSMNHALMLHNIAALHSVDPAHVAAINPLLPHVAGHFYPLGVHEVLAAGLQVGGGSPGRLLFAGVVLFACVVFPVGLYALASVLTGRRAVGVVALLLASWLVEFPVKPLSWGGVAELCGVAAVPGVLALVRWGVAKSPWWVVGVVGGLAGVAAIHSSEAVGVVYFGVVVGVGLGWKVWRRAVQWWVLLVSAGAGVVVVLFQALGLVRYVSSGGADAANLRAAPLQLLSSLVQMNFGLAGISHSYLVTLLVVAGSVVALRRGRGRAAVAGWGVAVILVAAAALPGSVGRVLGLLTTPWYQQAERLSYFVVMWSVILAAYAVSEAAVWVGAHLEDASEERRRDVAGVVGVLLALPFFLNGQWQGGNYLGGMLGQPVLSNRVLSWGEVHPEIKSRDVSVLSSDTDGSLWLYDESGVLTSGALDHSSKDSAEEAFRAERSYMLGHLREYDAHEQELLAKWRVGYVFVNARTVLDGKAVLRSSDLAGSPHLHLVDSADGAALYALVK